MRHAFIQKVKIRSWPILWTYHHFIVWLPFPFSQFQVQSEELHSKLGTATSECQEAGCCLPTENQTLLHESPRKVFPQIICNYILKQGVKPHYFRYLKFFPHSSYLFLIVIHARPTGEMLYSLGDRWQFLGEFFNYTYIIFQGIEKMTFIKDIREVAAVLSN